MDATLPFRWRKSPSHGKCSRSFCGSLRNYGGSHHKPQRETLDGHALKSNRREECALMPSKMSRSAPRPPFRLREVSIAVRTLRLSCRKAGKAPIFTPVRESSGESRVRTNGLELGQYRNRIHWNRDAAHWRGSLGTRGKLWRWFANRGLRGIQMERQRRSLPHAES